MFFTIYKITNKLDGKFYIGKHKTKNLNDGYMGSGKVLKRAIKKHGLENFSKEILHIFDNEEDMNAKEIELVVLSEQSYNLCRGGFGGFGYINENGLNFDISLVSHIAGKISAEKRRNRKQQNPDYNKEVCEKISSSLKDNFKNGMKNGFAGKKHSDEFKQKLSSTLKEKFKGSGNPQFGKVYVHDGKRNYPIDKDKLEIYLSNGFIKGRINKNTVSSLVARHLLWEQDYVGAEPALQTIQPNERI